MTNKTINQSLNLCHFVLSAALPKFGTFMIIQNPSSKSRYNITGFRSGSVHGHCDHVLE